MGPYSIEQRVSIIRTYYQNAASVRKTYRALSTSFGKNDRPTEQTIYRLVKKFEATGSVVDIKPTVRYRTGRSPKNIAAVRESVEKDPKLSLTQRSKLLGISQTTLSRILTEDLGFRPVAIENIGKTIVIPEEPQHARISGKKYEVFL